MNTRDLSDTLPDDLVGMRPAADLARCHLSTLYRLIGVDCRRPARLRAWKRGGRYFVSRAEVLGLFVPVQGKGGPAPEKPATARLEAAWARHRDEVLRRAGLAGQAQG